MEDENQKQAKNHLVSRYQKENAESRMGFGDKTSFLPEVLNKPELYEQLEFSGTAMVSPDTLSSGQKADIPPTSNGASMLKKKETGAFVKRTEPQKEMGMHHPGTQSRKQPEQFPMIRLKAPEELVLLKRTKKKQAVKTYESSQKQPEPPATLQKEPEPDSKAEQGIRNYGISVRSQKIMQFRKKQFRKADKRLKEAIENEKQEQAEGMAAGSPGMTVKGTVKKWVLRAARATEKTADAAFSVAEAPEQVFSGYTKAKARKQAMEKMDVSTMAKEAGTTAFRICISLFKKILKYAKALLSVMGIFGLLALVLGAVLWCIIFFIAAGVSSGNAKEQNEVVSESDMPQTETDYVFYNQGDYQTDMGGGQTVAQSGCGLTCLASVLATWTGNKEITPNTVVHYAKVHNTTTGSNGIILVSSGLYGGMCKEYGLTYQAVSKTQENLRLALSSGHSVIVMLSSSSKWTDGTYVTSRTHYIVLMKYEKSGRIACMNPAGGRLCYIEESTVLSDTGTDTLHVIYGDTPLNETSEQKAKGAEDKMSDDAGRIKDEGR